MMILNRSYLFSDMTYKIYGKKNKRNILVCLQFNVTIYLSTIWPSFQGDTTKIDLIFTHFGPIILQYFFLQDKK